MMYSNDENFFAVTSNRFANDSTGKLRSAGNVYSISLIKYGIVLTRKSYQCIMEKKPPSEVQIHLPDASVLSWPGPTHVLNFTNAQYLGTVCFFSLYLFM